MIENGLSENASNLLDAQMWSRMVPYVRTHTNESFLKDVEDLVILNLETQLAKS